MTDPVILYLLAVNVVTAAVYGADKRKALRHRRRIPEKTLILLAAAGGSAGALAAMSVKELEVIAFEELGCESVKKLRVENFPLLCAIDCNGGNIFDLNCKGQLLAYLY